jgi:hypothetical protein
VRQIELYRHDTLIGVIYLLLNQIMDSMVTMPWFFFHPVTINDLNPWYTVTKTRIPMIEPRSILSLMCCVGNSALAFPSSADDDDSDVVFL